MVESIEHVRRSMAVDHQRPWTREFAWLAAGPPPSFQRITRRRKTLDAMIAILGYQQRSIAIKRDSVRILQLARLVT